MITNCQWHRGRFCLSSWRDLICTVTAAEQNWKPTYLECILCQEHLWLEVGPAGNPEALVGIPEALVGIPVVLEHMVEELTWCDSFFKKLKKKCVHWVKTMYNLFIYFFHFGTFIITWGSKTTLLTISGDLLTEWAPWQFAISGRLIALELQSFL